MQKVMDAETIRRAIQRMAHEILEKGGGKDLTAAEGQTKKSDAVKSKKNYSLKDAQAALALADHYQ